MEFDVFGTRMIVERTATGWAVYYPPEEGKRRPVPGMYVPPDVTEDGMARYLADLWHEGASPTHPEVKRLR